MIMAKTMTNDKKEFNEDNDNKETAADVDDDAL